jgi:hypothetical protein
VEIDEHLDLLKITVNDSFLKQRFSFFVPLGDVDTFFLLSLLCAAEW